MYDGLHDRPVKHYFSPHEVRAALTSFKSVSIDLFVCIISSNSIGLFESLDLTVTNMIKAVYLHDV